MTWLKLDDSFPSHPKVVGLSDAAFRLHVTALCYCGQHLTDGLVPKSATRTMGAFRPPVIAALVDAGLWAVVDEGWQINGFLDYNPSRAKVEADRASAKERMDRVRANKRRTSGEVRSTPARPDPKGLGTESVFTSVVGEGATAGASPSCTKCGGTGWADVDGGVQRCTCHYLKAVNQ